MILTLTPNVTSAVTQQLADASPFDIDPDGWDLPVASFDEEWAESPDTEGGRRTRRRAQNPSGSISLIAKDSNTTNFWTAISNLQKTIETTATNRAAVKGYLAYTPDNGTKVTYVLESISLSGFRQDRHIKQGIGRVVLSFTCRPFGLLDPVALVTNATSSLPIQSVSLAGIGGSAPALVSATITDPATQARDHLEVGLDDDWDGVAALLIDSASLSVSGLSGATATRSGAYSGASNNVIRGTLSTTELALCEATGLTHKGLHRIKPRVFFSGSGTAYVRAKWRIGSGPWTENDWVTLTKSYFHENDLKMARVRHDATGTLTVRIEAKSTNPGDTLDIDYLMLMPATKALKLRIPQVASTPTSFLASDAFNQSAGALTGKTIPIASPAGAWAGAGDADDFSIDATNYYAQRTAVSDSAGVQNGRFAIAGTATPTDAVFKIRYLAVAGVNQGVFLHYTDTNNFLLAYILTGVGGFFGYSNLNIVERVAGTTTVLYTERDGPTAGGWHTFQFGTAGSTWTVTYDGSVRSGSTSLTSAGKIGFFDHYTSATVATRQYDDASAWVPDLQHVVNASGAITVDHEKAQRSDGTRLAPTGSYLTCMPAGREGRTHRLAVKLRRTDTDNLTDSQIADGQRIDVTVIPRVTLL